MKHTALNNYLKQRNLTAKHVAEAIHISASYFSKIANGRLNFINKVIMVDLANFLDLPLAKLEEMIGNKN